jgi:hypothetical protein
MLIAPFDLYLCQITGYLARQLYPRSSSLYFFMG